MLSCGTHWIINWSIECQTALRKLVYTKRFVTVKLHITKYLRGWGRFWNIGEAAFIISFWKGVSILPYNILVEFRRIIISFFINFISIKSLEITQLHFFATKLRFIFSRFYWIMCKNPTIIKQTKKIIRKNVAKFIYEEKSKICMLKDIYNSGS